MKFFWALLIFSFVFTGAAMFRFIRTGVPLEPTRALDPTMFAAPEQIGAALFRRFYPELNESHVIILASCDGLKNYDRVWQGLLHLAHEKKWRLDGVFSQEGLRPITAGEDKKFIDAEAVATALKADQRVVVQVAAGSENLKGLRKKFPGALFIEQEAYPARLKKLKADALTAAAEVDLAKVAHLYLYEPK